MFGKKKSFEEKQEEKMQEFKEKYHLNDLQKQDLDIVENIASDLAGSGFLKLGALLSSSGEDTAKITYLSALVEQNWLIINQLSRLNKTMEELLNK